MDITNDICKKIIQRNNSKRLLNTVKKEFYNLMRDCNIKRGTRIGNAVHMDNPEWVMAKCAFFEMLKSELELDILIGDVPKDLRE